MAEEPHFRAFTSHMMVDARGGKWAEYSDKSAPSIEFLAQGSIKPEPPWLVPLRKLKMPENEWKSIRRLFS